MGKWNYRHDAKAKAFKELCRSMEFDVEEINKVYQLRVSYFGTDVLDFFPKSGKYFDLNTKEWNHKNHSVKEIEEILTVFMFENS